MWPTIATCVLLGALAAAAQAPTPSRLAFVGVDVRGLEAGPLRRDQVVLTEGSKISAIGARGDLVVPGDALVIEARNRVLTPGLVDAHIHLRHADTTALVDYLRAGILCAREMNGRRFLLEWRDRIDAGELVGPWLHVAAPTLGNFSSPREGYATPQTGAQAEATVRRFRDAGYDWIKIYSFLPAGALEGVLRASGRVGLPVGGHVPVEVGLSASLSTGLRSIEHLTEYVGSALTPEARSLDEDDFRSLFGAGQVDWTRMDSLVEATAAAGIWNVPTLVWFDRHQPAPMASAAWSDPDLRDQGERNRREVVARLLAAGAPLAIGTDSDAGDQLPATAIHDELAAMAEAGLTPAQVLRLATVGGANLLGVGDETGTVTVGKRADLLLLPCDPAVDLACLREPQMIVARGRIVPLRDD